MWLVGVASGSGWNLWVWLAGGGCGWNLWVWLVGVVSKRRVWLVEEGGIYGCGFKEVIDFLILLIPTPLVSVLFYSSIPTFCSFLNVFHSCYCIFCNLCNNFFTQYKHIRATTGVPQKPYEGLHITKKHTQTNTSYPVMDISCKPSRAGCRSRSRGCALYRDASRGPHTCLTCAHLLQGAEISN